MADAVQCRTEQRKIADCTRRELGGAGATGTASVDEGRVAAVPSLACVVTVAAASMDGIRFKWRGGFVSDLIVMMRSARETVGKSSEVLTKYKNIKFVEALGTFSEAMKKGRGRGLRGLYGRPVVRAYCAAIFVPRTDPRRSKENPPGKIFNCPKNRSPQDPKNLVEKKTR